MNIDTEIAEVETFMGRAFKKRPRIMEWNFENIQEFLTEEAKLLGDPKPTLTDALVKARQGYSGYNFRTHTIISNGQKIPSLHELGHAYTNDQWRDAFAFPKKLQQKRKYSTEEWQALYAHRALHEGIANYVTLSLHKDARYQLFLNSNQPKIDEVQELHTRVTNKHAFGSHLMGAYGLGYTLVKHYCAGREPHEAIGELIELNPTIVEMGRIIEEGKR